MIAVNKWISEKKKEKTHKAWKKSKGVLHKLPTSWVILLSLPVCIMHLKNNGRKIFLMQYGLKFLQLTVHSYIESISQNTYMSHTIFAALQNHVYLQTNPPFCLPSRRGCSGRQGRGESRKSLMPHKIKMLNLESKESHCLKMI